MIAKFLKISSLSLCIWLGIFMFSPVFADASDFITTWKTDNVGTSTSTSVTIPTIGGGYSYSVDWTNDGVFDNVGVGGTITHDYGAPGTYQIRIQGSFPRILFNNGGDKLKILSIDQWGTGQWTSMNFAFYGCQNLQSTATDVPNLSAVTDMSHMFNGASSFNGDISAWDVSTVTNMYGLFNNASSFNQDLNSRNVGNVTNMGYMFNGASSFNQDLNSRDVSNVTDMTYMFAFASAFNGDISDWNLSSALNMFAMFSFATSFNSDISAWNVSNIVNMGYMFYGASSFNQNISSWMTTNLNNMVGMFNSATSFNQNISAWNVSNVTNMYSLFAGATSFNQPLSGWNMPLVLTFNSMFYGATSFNQDLSAWNVSNVTNMSSMFNSATSFNQNLSTWNVSNVTNMSFMFAGDTLSQSNYDALLIGWASQFVKNNVPFHGGNSTYCNGSGARDSLTTDYSWIITDGGYNCQDNVPPVVTLSGDALININQGDNYDEYGADWTDDTDGTGFVALPVSGSVDTNIVGMYILSYTYTDTAGNTGNTVVRMVNILPLSLPPVVSSTGYGGGGGSLPPVINTGTSTGTAIHSGSSSINCDTDGNNSEEFKSYCFARGIGSTTMPTFQIARYRDELTRAELSKVVSQFALGFLHKPLPNKVCNFKDIDLTASEDLKKNILLSCRLGLMGLAETGRPLIYFRPNDIVTRAEYMTVISRVLYGNIYDLWDIIGDKNVPFYTYHMNQLLEEQLINTKNPLQRLLRTTGFVTIYRLSKSQPAE